MPETAVSPYDDIIRQAQEETAPPPTKRQGPPVLPPTQGSGISLPSLSASAGKLRTSARPQTVPQILQPAAEAVQGLTRGGPDYSQAIKQAQQEQQEDDFTKHYLQKMPQFRAYSHEVHPEEEAFHQSQTALQTANPIAAQGFPSIAPDQQRNLQLNNSQALVHLNQTLPVLEKEFIAKGRELKAQSDALKAAVGQYKDKKLSPAAFDQLRRDGIALQAAQKAHDARAEQLTSYSQRFTALASQYKNNSESSVFPMVNEWGGGTKEGLGSRILKKITQYIPIPGVSGGVAAQKDIDEARNGLMLNGQYPAPPANPGKTPLEQEFYNKQQRDLVHFMNTRPFGKQTAPPGMPLNARQLATLTPYQRQIYPAVQKALTLEEKLQENIGLRRTAINFMALTAGYKAGGYIGGLTGTAAGHLIAKKYAPYLIEDPLSALLTKGVGEAAKNVAARGAASVTAGYLGGGVAGSTAAAAETALLGGSPKEAVRAAQENWRGSALWGTAGGFLHLLGTVAQSALLKSFDPAKTPEYVNREVNRWHSEGLVDEREAPLLKERLNDFAKTPRIMKEAAAEKLARDFQFIGDRARAQRAAAAGRPPTAERVEALPAAPTGQRMPVTIEGAHLPVPSPLETPLHGMDWRQVPSAVEPPPLSSPYPRQNALPSAPGTYLAGGQGQVGGGPAYPLVPTAQWPRPAGVPPRVTPPAAPTLPPMLGPGPAAPRALPPSGTVGTPLPGQGGVLLRGPQAGEPIPPSAGPLPPPSGQQPIPYTAAEQKGAGLRIRGPKGEEPPPPIPSPLEPLPPQTPPTPPASVERRLADLRQMQADIPPKSKAYKAMATEIAELERMGTKVGVAAAEPKASLPATAEALQAEIARLQKERSQHTIGTPEFGKLTSDIGRAQDKLTAIQHPKEETAPKAPEPPTTRALAVPPEIKAEVPEAVQSLEDAAHKAMLEAGIPEDKIHFDGQKYVIKGKITKELQQRLDKAKEIYLNSSVELTTPEGTTYHIKGLDISAGIEGGKSGRTESAGAAGVPAEARVAQPTQRIQPAAAPAQPGRQPELGTSWPERTPAVVAPGTQGSGETAGVPPARQPAAGGGTPANPPEVREPAARGGTTTKYQPGTVLKKAATGTVLRLDGQLSSGKWKATVVEPGSLNVKKGHVFSPVPEKTLDEFKPVQAKRKAPQEQQQQFVRDLLQDEEGSIDPKIISDKLKRVRARIFSTPEQQAAQFEHDLIEKYGRDENVPQAEWNKLQDLVKKAAAVRPIVDVGEKGGVKYGSQHPNDPRWQAVDADQTATWKVPRKIDNETALQKLQRYWDTWHYPHPELKGLPELEEFSQRLTEAQKRGIADMAAQRAFFSYMKGIENEPAHTTLSQLLFWRDLKRSYLKGLTLPAPYEPDMIEPGLLDTEVAAMRDPKVMQAFHKRLEVLTPIVTRRMELIKKIANFNMRLDPNDYMHRMILAYANEQQRLRGSIRHPVGVRGYEKMRRGSELPYEKALSETDMDWLPQMMYDNHVLGLYEHLYDHQNIYNQLKREAAAAGTTWDKLLTTDPKYKDYSTIRVTYQNPLHRAFTLPNRIAAMIQQNGTELVSDQDITEKTILGSPAKPLVVRKEIARAIERLNIPDNALDSELRGAAMELRRFMVLNPVHIAKFAAKKLGTDIETLVRNPATLPHYRRAIQEVVNFRRTKEWTPELEQYWDLGGFQGILQSGYGIRSKGIELLPKFLQQLPPENANPDVLGNAAKRAGALWTKYADRAGMEVTMLDSTTRYGAWLYARDYGMKHGGMMPGWGSSPPERLMAIGQRETGIDQEGINRRAWRWAQDMIGNYDERSAGNRWLSRRAKVLFPAWPEVNFRRYYRGTQNVLTSTQATDLGIAVQKYLNDHGAGGSKGGRAVGAAATWVAQLGYFAAGILALRAATQIYNELTPGVKDKEAGISPVLRDQPHITLPVNDPATGNPMVIMSPGGLGELFDHSPIDTNGIMHDYLHGINTGHPMTFVDVNKRLSEPWLERFSRAFGGPRQLMEVTNTRDMRSGAEQILTRAGLRDIYRLASTIPATGIPKERGRFARILSGAAGTYESDPGDNAYFNVRRDVGYFLNQRGVPLNEPVSRGTQRSNAFYWLQRSLRAGDRESALRYTADYAIASDWSNPKSLPIDNMRKDMIRLDPISELKPLERQEFIKKLTDDEKKETIIAYEDYRRMVAPEVKLPPVGKDFDQWIRDAQGRIFTGIANSIPAQTIMQIAEQRSAIAGAHTPAERSIQMRQLTPQQQHIQQRIEEYAAAHPARR